MPSSYSALLYHVVFTTKYRQPRLRSEVRPELYAYMGGILNRRRGVLLEIGGIEDHVHLLIGLRTDHALAEEIRHVKGSSSRWWNRSGLDGERRFAWQEGFGAFTVSRSQVPTLRRYIRGQPEHHKEVSFETEWQALLRRHRVDATSGLGWH
jgi:putative transposase